MEYYLYAKMVNRSKAVTGYAGKGAYYLQEHLHGETHRQLDRRIACWPAVIAMKFDEHGPDQGPKQRRVDSKKYSKHDGDAGPGLEL